MEENEKRTQPEETNKVETFDNQSVTVVKEENEKKEGKGNKLWLVAIALVAVLAIIGVYVLAIKNSQTTFTKALDKLEERMETHIENLDLEKKEVLKKFTLNSDVNINIESDFLTPEIVGEEMAPYLNIIDNINQMPIKVKIMADENNIFMNALANLKGENILDANLLFQNNKFYLLWKNVFDRYIQVDYELENLTESMQMNEISLEDYQYLLDVMKKSLKNSIQKSYIEEENTTIKIDGNDTKVKKQTLVLNGKNTKAILEKIVEDIKADKKANELMLKIYPEFETYQVEMNEEAEGILYNVYIKGANEIVKIEISNENNSISYTIGEKDTVEVINDGKSVATIEINSEKNMLEIIVKEETNTLGSIVMKNENDKITASMNISVEGIDIKGNYSVTKKDNTTNELLTLNVMSTGLNVLTASIEANSTIEENAQINEDASNAISIDQLTEEDQQKIMDGLEDLLEKLLQ